MKRFLAVVCSMIMLAVPGPASAFTNADVIDGFNKTVFSSEYASFSLSRPYVRKFPGTVRVFVRSTVGAARRNDVKRFLRSLNHYVHGLKVQIVGSERRANYVVHVVSRGSYEATVRREVLNGQRGPVRGRCMVRAIFSRSGISRSDAVIVGDEGNRLFRRCMTEEILQGLGPLDDHPSLTDSMFNDRTTFTAFRRFDRLIVSMLYDRRIRPGMSARATNRLLPRVLQDVRRRVERR